MYQERESNPHGLVAHRILSPACLPIPPSRHLRKKHRRTVPFSWSERRGSNPRPRPWQGRALPAELLSHSHSALSQRIVDANLGRFQRLSSPCLKNILVFAHHMALETDYECIKNTSTRKKQFWQMPAVHIIRMVNG